MNNTIPLRTDGDLSLNAIAINKTHDIFSKENYKLEWSSNGSNRDEDTTWIDRYKYEADLISNVIQSENYKKIIEIGSGPGKLSQFIQEKCNIDYSLIDDFDANEVFNNRKYKGKFFAKNLLHHFDITNLNNDYDLVIMNDFLEHICNPSNIIYNCRKITNKKSKLFISVPNWRMGHGFIYRGLFDYDNFIYFMYVHGYNLCAIAPSILKCKYYPKLETEKSMPDILLESWNWYLVFDKNENE
jgi:SAM-dependent methyltransferase